MRSPVALGLAICLTSVTSGTGAAAPLGRVEFPVTGGEAAQRHFLRGVLALHSFWYDEARDEFREATKAQPDFAMGYWGEALTYYHPIWEQEDVAATRAVLDKAPPYPNATARERAFIAAARELTSDGDRKARCARYAEAMRGVHERWPDDDEAATFYAVALLGTVDRKAAGFRRQAEAAALALEVLARNPDHPGAAHYVIHAFDDPEHAILALPAARRYAEIAPEAYHARHMPSHIFVQLGMWPEAATSNESSWAASDNWVKRKKLDPSHHDFHSLWWLQAIYVEQGQRKKAEEVLGRARADLTAVRDERASMRAIYVSMAAALLEATDAWPQMDDWLAPLSAPEPMGATSATSDAPGATCHPAASRAARSMRNEEAMLLRIKGEAALARKDAPAAERAATALAQVAAKMEPEGRDFFRVVELSLRGRAHVVRGDVTRGLTLLKQAAQLDEREPPSGPVDGVSARERLGEILFAAGRGGDALVAFRGALELHPRRARALYGAARAAALAHDPSAASYWSELRTVWAHADADQPGLDDLHHAVATASSR
jgi:tetratricopeptide (TPR) repeat protein